jgi:predicted  nucleic acid-binding Zn-ribbon protein
MDRIDKIMQIAEELSSTRSRTESTLVNLKSQLVGLKEQIDVSIHELENYGIESTLDRLNNIQERAIVIHRYTREIKQLSASLDQALGFIKAAKKLTSQ